MHKTCLAFPLLALGLAEVAQGQGIDARTNAMGGAAVSSADYLGAGFTNPALLTRSDEADDWGLVLPTFSVFASDPDELIDAADMFSQEYDRIDQIFANAGVPTQGEVDALANSLLNLNGRALQAQVGFGIGFARPSKDLGFAVIIDTRLTARSFVDVDPNDAALISGSIGSGDLPDLGSAAAVTGGLVSDYGVAFARDFGGLSVGVTPKFQRVETYNYRVDANDFDENSQEDDFTDPQFRETDSGFNLDLGVAYAVSQQVDVGLNLRNLVSRDIQSVTTLGQSFTYQIEPVATAGASWSSGSYTLAADIDLTKTEPFDFAPGSQFLSLGGELAWRWAQLRAGLRLDLESETEDVVTAGFGLSPWGIFHFDLAGLFGDDTYGGSLRLGWSF